MGNVHEFDRTDNWRLYNNHIVIQLSFLHEESRSSAHRTLSQELPKTWLDTIHI